MKKQMNALSMGSICMGGFTTDHINTRWSFGKVYDTGDACEFTKNVPISIELLFKGEQVGHLEWGNRNDLHLNGEMHPVRSLWHAILILSNINTPGEDISDMLDPAWLKEQEKFEWLIDLHRNNECIGCIFTAETGAIQLSMPLSTELQDKMRWILMPTTESTEFLELPYIIPPGNFNALMRILKESTWHDNPQHVKDIPESALWNVCKDFASGIYRTLIREEGNYKHPATELIFGCNEEELYAHLIRNRDPELDRKAYVVDHIVPLSGAITLEELMILYHHSNLQSLTRSENAQKSDVLVPRESLPKELHPTILKIYEEALEA